MFSFSFFEFGSKKYSRKKNFKNLVNVFLAICFLFYVSKKFSVYGVFFICFFSKKRKFDGPLGFSYIFSFSL
jgi:hypothetical protein